MRRTLMSRLRCARSINTRISLMDALYTRLFLAAQVGLRKGA
jgi:hypothetical protein